MFQGVSTMELVGGWYPQPQNDGTVKEIAKFAVPHVQENINSSAFFKLGSIESAHTQARCRSFFQYDTRGLTPILIKFLGYHLMAMFNVSSAIVPVQASQCDVRRWQSGTNWRMVSKVDWH